MSANTTKAYDTEGTPAEERNGPGKSVKTPMFGIGYRLESAFVFVVPGGSLDLGAKELAKIERGSEMMMHEMQKRANAYPELIAALRGSVDEDADTICVSRDERVALLAKLGESS